MSDQKLIFPNIPKMISGDFISGIVIGQKMIPNVTVDSLIPVNWLFSEYSEITVKKDDSKEYIEFDIKNMIKDKLYSVEYQNELQLVKKISDDKIVFYDVVE